MKRCSRCNQDKPPEAFHKDKSRKGGLYSYCKLCAREAQRKWVAENYEHVRAKAKARYQNPEHRKKAIAATRAWIDAHPEWHKITTQVNRARRKAVRRGVENTLTVPEWRAILETADSHCSLCGEQGPMELDHVLDFTRGGANTFENVQPLCKACHDQKTIEGGTGLIFRVCPRCGFSHEKTAL